MIDLTTRVELAREASLIRDLQRLAPDADWLIVGAFARDLLLHWDRGIALRRRTTDVDLGISISSWDDYASLRARLMAGDEFRRHPHPHRLVHRATDLPVDLIPFGGVEGPTHEIEWPHDPGIRLQVLGYAIALESAELVRLEGCIATRVATMPMQVALKLLAWRDRHREHAKDAGDLHLILGNMLTTRSDVLYDAHADLLDHGDFDLARAGARIAGREIAHAAAGSTLLATLRELLQQELDGAMGDRLQLQMSRTDPDSAGALLGALLSGLLDRT